MPKFDLLNCPFNISVALADTCIAMENKDIPITQANLLKSIINAANQINPLLLRYAFTKGLAPELVELYQHAGSTYERLRNDRINMKTARDELFEINRGIKIFKQKIQKKNKKKK